MFNLARKNHLAMNLNKLRKQYPDNYSFFPKTWILPADKADLVAQFKDRKPKTFILKPQASCQGRGIMLVQYPEQIPDGEPMVAQRYVLKPYLLDGLKFDLRIYYLVAGCDPLRLYIFKEGMARLATNEYIQPNKANIQNMFMHLTNYAINKFNKEFVQNDGEDDGSGHKRLMSWVFKHMKENGVDTDQLWKEIKLLALKTLCVAQPQLAHHYRSGQSEDYYGHMCFEILGFDVLIDSNAKPILLEVNHTPSFSTDSKLDHELKSKVIHDAIVLMQMTQKMKTKLIAQKKKEAEARVITGKRIRLSMEEREEAKKKCQEERDKYIKKHMGGYEQIYPLPEGEVQTEPYEEFMQFAKKEFEIQTGAVKKQPKTEQPVTKPAFGSRIPVEPPKKKIEKVPEKKLVVQRSVELKSSTQLPTTQPPSVQLNQTSALPSRSELPESNTPVSLSATVARKHPKIEENTSVSNPSSPLTRALTLENPGPSVDPRFEQMRMEIVQRVENQELLRKQMAFKVQMQRGLVPQPLGWTGEANLLKNSTVQRRPMSNDRQHRNPHLHQIPSRERLGRESLVDSNPGQNNGSGIMSWSHVRDSDQDTIAQGINPLQRPLARQQPKKHTLDRLPVFPVSQTSEQREKSAGDNLKLPSKL
jgi:tubulin polyglutamylase TTLL6/13